VADSADFCPTSWHLESNFLPCFFVQIQSLTYVSRNNNGYDIRYLVKDIIMLFYHRLSPIIPPLGPLSGPSADVGNPQTQFFFFFQICRYIRLFDAKVCGLTTMKMQPLSSFFFKYIMQQTSSSTSLELFLSNEKPYLQMSLRLSCGNSIWGQSLATAPS
jgi:hypothetical protein